MTTKPFGRTTRGELAEKRRTDGERIAAQRRRYVETRCGDVNLPSHCYMTKGHDGDHVMARQVRVANGAGEMDTAQHLGQ